MSATFSQPCLTTILSHAHGDHDGGAVLLQDSIPGVHLIYGAEDWDAVDKRSEFDDAYFKAHTAANRKPGEQNPFDVGTDGVAVASNRNSLD